MIPQYVMPSLSLPSECSLVTEGAQTYIVYEALKELRTTRIAVRIFNGKQQVNINEPTIVFAKKKELILATSSAIEAALLISAKEIETIYREKGAALLDLLAGRVARIAVAYGRLREFSRKNFAATDELVVGIVKWIEYSKEHWFKICPEGGTVFIKKAPPIPFSVVVSKKTGNIYLHMKKLLEKGSGKRVLTTYEYTKNTRLVRLKPHHKRAEDISLSDVRRHWQNEIRINDILREAKGRGIDMTGIMETIEHVTIRKGEGLERHIAYQELCEGDLLNMMDSMSEMAKFRHGATIAQGLATLHRLGLIHLDLKLENILILRDEAKITDFGFAATSGQEVIQDCKGTYGYIAPEFFCDAWESKYNKQNKPPRNTIHFDNWSLGVLLASLMYGHNLAVSETQVKTDMLQFQIEVNKLNTTAEPEKHLSRRGGLLGLVGMKKPTYRFDNVLWGLFRKEPEERWSSEQAAKVMLEICKAKDAEARVAGASFAKPKGI